MKNSFVTLSAITAMTVLTTSHLMANSEAQQVYDFASLQAAIAKANNDATINRIVFKKGASFNIYEPIIYTGTQDLNINGNGAIIDGSMVGSLIINEDLTAVTNDATLMFNSAGSISINNLSVMNSATRGIVVNVPAEANDKDSELNLRKVSVLNSALYGVHIDDNSDEFDDGNVGSNVGINLNISGSTFVNNGTGAIDFDGIRVDERAAGSIHAVIINSHIDGNGGDGIELDEAGIGDVEATMINVTISENGFYNAEDLDDGFDIDEADDGNIEVKLINVEVNNNKDEGLDFDEAGNGKIKAKLRKIEAFNNNDEGIKFDEEDKGSIKARLTNVHVKGSGDDGIQFTELGDGKINSKLNNVTSENNKKYGIKMEQWNVEDEETPVEKAGKLKTRNVSLSNNEKGDDIKLNNIILK